MKENKSHFGLKRLVMPILFLLMCVPFALAQDPVKVTGKVLDNLGEPMIGVSVQVKGTSHGAITDIDGNYSVSVEPGARWYSRMWVTSRRSTRPCPAR